MAACKGCGSEIRWMDTFPGDICVNCHKEKMKGADATAAYNQMMGTFTNPKVAKVQELRRSNAAGPTKSKKSYQRKPKHPKADNE